jgi:hypothetical protein
MVGVVAASGGNHGVAVAYAAMKLKLPAKRAVCSTLVNRSGGLRLGGAGRQPRHDSSVTIAATGELMLLSCLRRKGGSLLFGLSPLPG